MINRVLTDGDKSDGSDTQRGHGKSGIYMTGNYVRYSIYALASLIIIAQFISSTAAILDTDHGNYSDGHEYAFTYNDLRSFYLQANLFRFLSFANITTQRETLYTPEHTTYLTTDVPILPSASPKT